jgi:hypothetical protein
MDYKYLAQSNKSPANDKAYLGGAATGSKPMNNSRTAKQMSVHRAPRTGLEA